MSDYFKIEYLSGLEKLEHLCDKIRLFALFAEQSENELEQLRKDVRELTFTRNTLALDTKVTAHRVEQFICEQEALNKKVEPMLNAIDNLMVLDTKDIQIE